MISTLIHRVALMAIAALLFVYYFDKTIITAIHEDLAVIAWLFDFIPYVKIITPIGSEVQAHYLCLNYILFTILFINLGVAAYPAFSGVPKITGFYTLDNFYRLLEQELYGKVTPSISLVNRYHRPQKIPVYPRTIHATTHKELIRKFMLFSRDVPMTYALIGIASFAGFPYLLNHSLTYHDSMEFQFGVYGAIMIFGQLSILFEIIWLILATINHREK